MSNSITIGNFDATLEYGKWIYKAKEQGRLINKNAQYKENPQYDISDQIEATSKDRFRKELNKSVIEITKFIKEHIL